LEQNHTGQELSTSGEPISREDLRSLIPTTQHLSDPIINKYLKSLALYMNARRGSGSSNAARYNRIAVIENTADIHVGLLRSLADFSMIYVPIKVGLHWTLIVLYPRYPGEVRGRIEVYDSHPYWSSNSMTESNIYSIMNFRLGAEFASEGWVANVKQYSRPHWADVDSGLYVLANAKSIAFNLGLMELHSREHSRLLRWQIAHELMNERIVEEF